MKFSWKLMALLLGFLTPNYTEASVKHLVLAHYMVCCPRFGHESSVEEYQLEIEAAKKLGVDGFVLNIGSWSQEPYYKKITTLMYEAAKRSGNEFKLALSLDWLNVTDSVDAVSTFYYHPNQLRINGTPVVSTYGEDHIWNEGFTQQMNERNYPIALIAGYDYGRHDLAANIEKKGKDFYVARLAMAENPNIAGYFFFGAGNEPDILAREMRDISELAKQNRKISMVGIAPYYKGFGPKNSRVFESNGFSGMQTQWTAAIEAQTDWVEIVTWNDWGEATYVSPLTSPLESIWGGHWGALPAHDKFLEASSYYIKWFKTGCPPKIENNVLYYFYRLHPKTAIGQTQPPTNPSILGRPVGWEKLKDEIFFTAFLNQPRQISLTIEGKRIEWDAPSGVQSHSFPMALGPLSVTISDQGNKITHKQLEFDITEDGTRGNFNYFAGSVIIP